jgi:hypothetical protein
MNIAAMSWPHWARHVCQTHTETHTANRTSSNIYTKAHTHLINLLLQLDRLHVLGLDLLLTLHILGIPIARRQHGFLALLFELEIDLAQPALLLLVSDNQHLEIVDAFGLVVMAMQKPIDGK